MNFFLVSLISLLLSHPSCFKDRIIIWGDFFFNMKRNQAIAILEKSCKNIDYETRIYARVNGQGCTFSIEPFQNMESSIDLVFDHAFFKINKRLKYIGFSFEDYNKEELERLYKYSDNNWYISSKWTCTPPLKYSSIQKTVQTCGASFHDGRVRLSNTISLTDEIGKNSKSQASRTTSMYFYAFPPKHISTGNP